MFRYAVMTGLVLAFLVSQASVLRAAEKGAAGGAGQEKAGPGESAEKPADEPAKQPAGDAGGKPGPGEGGKPAGKPGEKPAKQPGGEPGKQPAPGEGGKPAGKPAGDAGGKPAQAVRDVPAPPEPSITSVPPGARPDDWISWAQDQDVTEVRRLVIHFTGFMNMSGGGYAGNGEGAPMYDELFQDGICGAGAQLEVGTPLLPLLHLQAAFRLSNLSGGSHDSWTGSMMQTTDFSDMMVLAFQLCLKAKFPLLVWQLRSSHFRFTRAEELTGLLLFVHYGAGGAWMSRMTAEVHSGSGMTYEVDYWNSSFSFSSSLVLGLELRWDWGGLTASYAWNRHGAPDSAWSPNSDAEPLETFHLRLGFSFYFA